MDMFSADQAELLRLVAGGGGEGRGGGGGGREESEEGVGEGRRGREEGREDPTHATLKMHMEAMTFDTSTGLCQLCIYLSCDGHVYCCYVNVM